VTKHNERTRGIRLDILPSNNISRLHGENTRRFLRDYHKIDGSAFSPYISVEKSMILAKRFVRFIGMEKLKTIEPTGFRLVFSDTFHYASTCETRMSGEQTNIVMSHSLGIFADIIRKSKPKRALCHQFSADQMTLPLSWMESLPENKKKEAISLLRPVAFSI
jgi:hypothetical protein